MPPNAGGPPPSGNRTSLFIVLGILAVLLVIGGAFAVFGLSSGGGEAEGGSTAPGALPTEVAPTDDLPTDGLPSDLLTDLPTDLTDLPSLPTEGGPSESQYLEVATAFVAAARDGDCDKARGYANDAFNASVSDENLCEGTTREALEDDDVDDYDIEFFGTYGALVTFDDGQTNVSLVSQPDGDPQVQYFIAF